MKQQDNPLADIFPTSDCQEGLEKARKWQQVKADKQDIAGAIELLESLAKRNGQVAEIVSCLRVVDL